MKKGFITKMELGLMYFPDSTPDVARNHLIAWIKKCEKLTAELEAIGYNRKSKFFTPKEVSLIYQYLGEP